MLATPIGMLDHMRRHLSEAVGAPSRPSMTSYRTKLKVVSVDVVVLNVHHLTFGSPLSDGSATRDVVSIFNRVDVAKHRWLRK